MHPRPVAGKQESLDGRPLVIVDVRQIKKHEKIGIHLKTSEGA